MKNERAFTLPELLVALAITAVLIILLANVVSATLGAWQQGRKRLDTFSNARQVMGRLADELSASIAAKDRIEFLENEPSLASSPAPTPDPKKSENLFFVAPYPNAGSGDLCVIAYRHNSSTQRLERAFKDSAAAWNAGATNRYKLAGYNGSPPAGFEWRPIADGVLEFEIRSYSQQNLDAGQEYDDPGDPIEKSWKSTSVNATMEGKTPRRIVVRLKVVDDRTLTRLRAVPPNSTQYKELLQSGAREFFANFSLVSQ